MTCRAPYLFTFYSPKLSRDREHFRCLDMTLTEEQLNIFARHPLDDSLARFTDKLSHLEGSTEVWRTEIATLLGLLVATPAAYNLPSREDGCTVAVKLFPIQPNVRGGSPKFDHFRPLIDAVVTGSSDPTKAPRTRMLVHGMAKNNAEEI